MSTSRGLHHVTCIGLVVALGQELKVFLLLIISNGLLCVYDSFPLWDAFDFPPFDKIFFQKGL